jgi:hypothetical protein
MRVKVARPKSKSGSHQGYRPALVSERILSETVDDALNHLKVGYQVVVCGHELILAQANGRRIGACPSLSSGVICPSNGECGGSESARYSETSLIIEETGQMWASHHSVPARAKQTQEHSFSHSPRTRRRGEEFISEPHPEADPTQACGTPSEAPASRSRRPHLFTRMKAAGGAESGSLREHDRQAEASPAKERGRGRGLLSTYRGLSRADLRVW